METKKFLIALPLYWAARCKIQSSHSMRIAKTFLRNNENKKRYVKALLFNGGLTKYSYGRETAYGNFLETTISNEEYVNHVMNGDHLKYKIEKTRYFIIFLHYPTFIDVYENRLTGLALLKQKFDSKIEKAPLFPPYFKPCKDEWRIATAVDVSADSKYDSYNLADVAQWN